MTTFAPEAVINPSRTLTSQTKEVCMKIRDAEINDLYEIVGLLADDILGKNRETHTKPLPKEYIRAFEQLSKQQGNRLIVAVDEDGIVQGCLQLTIVPGIARRGTCRATIEGVRVSSDMRRSGLGGALFEYAIEEARQAECDLVQLTTDQGRPEAHKFYERQGFEPTHIGMKLAL